MITDFVMPKLGHLMEEAKVLSWRKAVGDRVEKGETLLEVETDKSAIEVESPVTGVLTEIVAGPDTVAPVGEVLARFETE
jgi:pyruvate/2-oxoglutarate dehydrogenase complex dihydrolipoamide acyltransferase (E2) component